MINHSIKLRQMDAELKLQFQGAISKNIQRTRQLD